MLEFLGLLVAGAFMLFAGGATWLGAAELLVSFLLWGHLVFGAIWLLFTLISLVILALGGAVLGGGAGFELGGGIGGLLGVLGGAGLVGAIGLISSITYLLRKALMIGGLLMILRGFALIALGGGWVVWIVVGALAYLVGFLWLCRQRRRARRSSSD